jgi:N-acetylneuraminate lyase
MRLNGIIPAVFTPMHPDGSLNLAPVASIVDRLAAEGAAALYVCGSTGEGPSLTREERISVAEAYIQAAAGRLPVVVQVGHDSLNEARILAAHAVSAGAHAISAVPPVYYKIDSLDLLVACLQEICAAAPALPFYYYHIPRLTSVRIDVVELLKIADKKLPTLCGVKYSDFTIFELQACAALDGGRYNILFGSDEMLLSGLVGGAHGAVGTTYSFALPLYQRIYTAFQRGDLAEARRLQGLSVAMLRVINRYASPSNNLPPMKSVMKLIGEDCGPLRLPLPTLTPDQESLLRGELDSIGFFSW